MGLTAVYLLTGKFPNDFLNDPANGELVWQADAFNVEPHLAKVLDQAIATHPRDRFNNANAMARALQVSTDLPIPVTRQIVPDTSPSTVVSKPTIVSPSTADPSVYIGNVPAYPIEPAKRGMAARLSLPLQLILPST